MSSEVIADPIPFGQREFRDSLGLFCSGVTIVTTLDGDKPAGFACQSFSSVSLDPPLILFCPMKTSSTWQVVEKVGMFAINVLAEDQQAECSAFARKGGDKFREIHWHRSSRDLPLLEGASVAFECAVHNVVDAGDHWVVIGQVLAIDNHLGGSSEPLLFHQGKFRQLSGRTIGATPARNQFDLGFAVPGGDGWF